MACSSLLPDQLSLADRDYPALLDAFNGIATAADTVTALINQSDGLLELIHSPQFELSQVCMCFY